MTAGCSGPLSTLDPAGPRAAGIATLWWIMLAGAAVIFAVVMALGLLVMLRPDVARRVPVRHWVLWGGLAVPLPVILALTAASLWLGESHRADPALRIAVEGRMWEWRFRYPGGAESVGVLHLPVGREVELAVTSPDVIHSFWIPRLGGKIDAIPGHTNLIRLRADAPGEYGGVCAEYCGIGHAAMDFTAEAHADWPPRALAEDLP